jgi:hypothetical protein
MKKVLLFLSLCSQAWSLSCSTPVTLSQPGLSHSRPKVIIGERGEALTLWIGKSEDEEEKTLFAATMNEKKEWLSSAVSKPERWIHSPKPFIDFKGNNYAVWESEKEDSMGKRYDFYVFSKKEKNSSWSTPLNIVSPEDKFIAFNPYFDANGNVILYGYQRSDFLAMRGAEKIMKYHHDTDEKKMYELSKGSADISISRLIQNKLGKTYVFWLDNLGWNSDSSSFSKTLEGAWFQDDSSLSNPKVIHHFNNVRYFNGLKAAMNSHENMALVWSYEDNVEKVDKIQAMTYFDHEWSEPVDLAISKNMDGDIKITLNDNGDIVTAWTAYEAKKEVLYLAEKPKGESWSSPVCLSDVKKDATGPKIAIDNEGNILTAWKAKEGRKWAVYAAYKHVGKPWTSPVLLSNKTDDCSALKVSVNNAGHFIVFWMGEQKKRSSIHAAALSTKTEQWSYALLSPEGQQCGNFSFAFNQRGQGVIAWTTTWDYEEKHIQAAELMVD